MNQNRSNQFLLLLVAFATLAHLSFACKSDVKLKQSNVQAKPGVPGEEEEVTEGEVDPEAGGGGGAEGGDGGQQFRPVEGLAPSSKYYQTRSLIRLYSNLDVDENSDYRLVNTTTGSILRQHFSSSDVQDTFNTASFSLAEGNVFETIVPSERIPTGALRYGKNVLRLLVAQDGQEYSYAGTEIHIVDFPVFSFASSAFATDVQSSGGFQGWVSPLAPPATASPTLAVGFFEIINR